MGTDFGRALGAQIAMVWLISMVIAAVVGWAAIEGAIWLFHHLRIGLVP